MDNKQGFVVSGLATVLLYFGFVLLIILFFFIFKFAFGEHEVPIKSHISDTDVNYEVLNYLRMPTRFKIDDKEINSDMADLIVRYFLAQGTENEAKFQALVREKTKEIFDGKYPHLKWKLKVSDKMYDSAKAVASEQTASQLTKDDTLVKGTSVACAILPNPGAHGTIKVELDFLNLNSNAFERAKYDSLKNNAFNC
ncbi:hypothetical protein J4204_02690 [Candidatus Woesearchaeota archaeon]|nr:hypothetical protein [Candidatus Woesearchaeota archaeon]